MYIRMYVYSVDYSFTELSILMYFHNFFYIRLINQHLYFIYQQGRIQFYKLPHLFRIISLFRGMIKCDLVEYYQNIWLFIVH